MVSQVSSATVEPRRSSRQWLAGRATSPLAARGSTAAGLEPVGMPAPLWG